MLKPGGAFLALFPTRDIWFEGHVGLYFAHWLSFLPKLQRAYLRAAHSLGFGYYRLPEATRWSDAMGTILQEVCFYHRYGQAVEWWREVFGQEPQSLATEYMAFRLEAHPRLGHLAWLSKVPAGPAFLSFICHKRAGRVWAVRHVGQH